MSWCTAGLQHVPTLGHWPANEALTSSIAKLDDVKVDLRKHASDVQGRFAGWTDQLLVNQHDKGLQSGHVHGIALN